MRKNGSHCCTQEIIPIQKNAQNLGITHFWTVLQRKTFKKYNRQFYLMRKYNAQIHKTRKFSDFVLFNEDKLPISMRI